MRCGKRQNVVREMLAYIAVEIKARGLVPEQITVVTHMQDRDTCWVKYEEHGELKDVCSVEVPGVDLYALWKHMGAKKVLT